MIVRRAFSARSTSRFRHVPATFSRRRHRTRAGLTMVELVAALGLFVLILGCLLTVMDTATSLWSSSRSQQTESANAETIAQIIDDDLCEAVTDDGIPTNSASAGITPAFILSSPPTNAAPGDVRIVLGFARHASPRTYVADKSATRLSLDAVFYTCYQNALFRHTIPLSYSSYDKPETLGELLDACRSKVENTSIHEKILTSVQDLNTTVSAAWSYLLLSERAEIELLATLPSACVRNAAANGGDVSLSDFEATALPDRIDLAVRCYNAADWADYQGLKNNTTAEAELKKRRLGTVTSKRITFPAKGGSRLP